MPGAVTDGTAAAAYEPQSGYAGDPSGTAAGFLEAALGFGASFVRGSRVTGVALDGGRAGVETDRGPIDAPNVAVVAGAQAAELARTVGVDVLTETWRHHTAYFGLLPGHGPSCRSPSTRSPASTRPEGHDLLLVGLEAGS